MESAAKPAIGVRLLQLLDTTEHAELVDLIGRALFKRAMQERARRAVPEGRDRLLRRKWEELTEDQRVQWCAEANAVLLQR